AALDPTNTDALAQTLSRLHRYTVGDLLVTASLSGAYSGPLGHIRSAIGAVLNATDELVTGEIGALAHLPGFERGEARARLFGVAESMRTFPAMTGRYWKRRIAPEALMGESGFEDLKGPAFTGKARPLGVMLEAHGYYHSVATHLMTTQETYALAMKRAVREAGPGASADAVASRYADLMKELPDDLVAEVNKVALDRRYIAKQSKVAESLLGLVGTRFTLIPGVEQSRAAWLRPLFVAARFGIGFAGRQVEFSGGGLV